MKKKLITLFMAFTVCLTISLPAYAADMQENTISAEKFYAEIAKEYEKYNIRIEVENIDPTFVYTEKMLEEEVVRVRAELASIENFDEMTGRFVSYNTETESITGTLNEANPASVMPYDMYYSVLTDDSYLTQAQVVDAGYQFGLHPRYIARTISPYAEIDADRPIFLHSTDGNPLFGHALVMRGYNISSNVYSIWNPWRNYFESMDISTNIYVADSSTSFEWTKTIYGWA